MKVTVPIVCGQMTLKDKEALFKSLKAFDADEVFLSFIKGMNVLSFDPDTLKKEAEILREKGFKVAAWLATFSQPNFKEGANHGLKICINGQTANSACPLSREFTEDYCELIKTVAKTGIKKIVLDDDLRMQTVFFEACCFCPEHMKFYSDYLGRQVTLEEMREGLLCGEVNEYRSAWKEGCRAALDTFCRAVRRAADEVDESIELMLCAGPALFGADGTNAFELIEILAGKNAQREFRLIGAPYWGPSHKLVSNTASAYDFARHQAYEAKKRGYITVGEDDPHPRPRYECPAYETEFFHTVMLADGNVDRVMKYGLDYYSDFSYEKGYAQAAERNKTLYGQIEEMFAGKKCVGFYLAEPFDRIDYAKELCVMPELSVIRSAPRKFLNDLSLPAVFEEGGVNVIFGENARNIDKGILKYGSILDIKAALILKERGCDTGIEKCNVISTPEGGITEIYTEQSDNVNMMHRPQYVYDCMLKAGVSVQTVLCVGENRFTASYVYENESGERYLVFCYDFNEMAPAWGYVRNYYRQKQVVKAAEWLNRKKLAAVCLGSPDLYIMTKTDGNSLAIGLWNHFADPVFTPEILLGEKYGRIKFINCDGVLKGDKIILSQPVNAFSYCFMEVTK